ncbi:MAG TPA: hypothetical protein VMK82_00275, partial [Steroidobacteraceae bacterium]|nr:hypothetical protein [Steroidobacteraceae bacterium]
VVAVNLWRELRAERVVTTELRAQLLGSQPAPWVPASAVVQVNQPASGEILASQPAAAKPEPSATAEGDKPAPQATQNADLARAIFNQQEMMKDPEYRKARLAQTRMGLPQNYPGLVEELGLTPEEADRLFSLMAENQLEKSDLSMAAATFNGVPPDPATMEDVNRRRSEMQRRHDDALMSMLGSLRYSQYQDYQQTRPARQQVLQLSRALEGVGMPLTAEQSRPLTDAYIAEQKRQREEFQRLASSNIRQPSPQEQAKMMEERYQQQVESNRRLLDTAKAHLSSQQLETLQDSLDQQLVMNRASSRLLRQQMETQGQYSPPSISFSSITIAPPVPQPPP